MRKNSRQGFTLIELSIVLVIIGLIVGGVLVGQDLINAAEIRATISQIEKYRTAVNAFRIKYNCLPGDCANAANYGFAARGSYPGEGDGDGVIEGITADAASMNIGKRIFGGETAIFWEDLSQAGLIDGYFNTGIATSPPASVTTPQVASYFPRAKIGRGNYVYVYSGGWIGWFGGWGFTDGLNYFALSGIQQSKAGTFGIASGLASLKVIEASNIDGKMDDGFPQSGKVMAAYPALMAYWAKGGTIDPNNGSAFQGDSDPSNHGPVLAGDGVSTASSATTCYDNGGVAGATEQYSLVSGGSGLNCALSFQF
jgi:prepilin-type N-terminal cleavage/methylation domain-containing protein